MKITKALIIAAGNGSRLRRHNGDVPKPLRKVCGMPLLSRIILSAKLAGITEFVIVVGYQKEQLCQKLKEQDLGVKLTFVENPDWEKSNGLSVLAAENHLSENFVLLMADHLFDPRTLQKLKDTPLGSKGALLAIDKNIKGVFDLEDATKVVIDGQAVIQIGKKLSTYNAIDTGLFLASPGLFKALREIKNARENCSLSEGIALLSERNQMGIFDIQGAYWQDVDTPESLLEAEKHLLAACRKSTDGIVSRHLNRPISLFISRWLIKTNLSANAMTAVTSLVGVLSAVFAAQGDYWNGLWGAILFKLASILDGCDGEISKLKMTSSKLGQWLDTLSDNLSYIIFIIGVILGVAKLGNPHVFLLGSLTLFGLMISVLVMGVYLVRHTNSGSLVTVQTEFQNSPDKNWLQKIFGALVFTVKRDFFALLFLVLAILGRMDLILWFCLIGANLTWLVLMNTKLGIFKSDPIPAKQVTNIR